MSIRVMSAGRSFEYLLKSVAAGDGDRDLGTPLTRYYTAEGTPPGTWLGSGLPGLGGEETGRLHEGDPVTEEQLERLLGSGLDPVTGAKLGTAYPVLQPPSRRIAGRIARLDASLDDATRTQQVAHIEKEERARSSRTPVAGFDLTFSPPKSFSGLWGVTDAGTQSLLAQAHHAALRDTLNLLERQVAATRVGHGGVASMPVRGVIAAAFDHYDTRAGDPQLHTHVVVSNKVQGEDGKWRTLDSRTLHRATVALSASYNAFLADHATQLVRVSWAPVARRSSQFTGWEIDGVPAELLAEFSRRTLGVHGAEGIEQAAQRLIGEYRTTHGHSPSQAAETRLRQQATLETRPEKELHSLAELTADWRARATSVLGQDATLWARELLTRPPVEAVLRVDDLPMDRLHDIAAVVLMEVGNRRATWGHWNLYAEAARQTMGFRFASADDRERVLARVVARAEQDSIRLTPEYDRLVPARFVNPTDGTHGFQRADEVAYTSQDILDAETRLLEHAADQSGPRLSLRFAYRHTSRPIRGVKLGDDQAAAILQLATSGRALDVLVGPAGTGKTTALRALHRAWTSTHGKDSVIGLAPSAAAADVLGQELGIRTENTAKYLHEYTHGRWNLKPGQLVLIDEASLAGTLALDRIASHAAAVGAKVVLIGDNAQLSAVETGGAFGMLARTRDDVAELVDVRRFSAEWEKTASLGLRHGDPTVLDNYVEHGRVHDGDQDTMLDALYRAWSADRDAGLRSVMIAATAETVTALNERARADLVAAGQVQESGVALRDDTTAGTGDVIVTRLNDRRLTAGGGSWVKNGDRWQATRTFQDGALAVRRLGKNDTPHGRAVVLPASYVAESVELGYATTTHRAQGSTVDTAHALIDPQTASRELLYVALTRGRNGNHAYVIDAPDENVEAHHDLTEPTTATERLARVLGRSDAEHSATETMQLAVEEHTSLRKLLREYETIASYAQEARWAALIDNAPLGETIRDDVFACAYYPALQATLRRAESHGYEPERMLAAAASALDRYQPVEGTEPADPGLLLTRWIDKVTAQPRHGTNRPGPSRVAGLLPRPIGPMDEDMRAAMAERQHLIERAVQQLTVTDLEAGAAWTKRLGTPGNSPRQQAEWFRAAATIRFYRERHDITGASPLGNPDQMNGLEQAYEYRAARAAYTRTRYLTAHQPGHGITRTGPDIDRGRGISL
ncbi:MAG TPA: MobF family relaxase [Galbitalea sp.]|jgi:conjugative relaxase-like TrwC/TraI family protein|nr:MobF family relaxase [Galbitalea sp.]